MEISKKTKEKEKEKKTDQRETRKVVISKRSSQAKSQGDDRQPGVRKGFFVWGVKSDYSYLEVSHKKQMSGLPSESYCDGCDNLLFRCQMSVSDSDKILE